MTIGISYPLRVVNGSLSVSGGVKLTDEHVISILETHPGERVMRREQGLKDQTFNSLKPTLVDSSIENALRKGSPVDLSDASVAGDYSESDQGIYRVSITYKDRNLTLNLG